MKINDTHVAYALGYYQGRAIGCEEPGLYEESTDMLRYFYKQGYEAGVGDYCRENHPEEYPNDF